MKKTVLRREVPISSYTTFGIGGKAEIVGIPKSVEQLRDIIEKAECEGLKMVVLGGGSDILFPDEGFKGLVIRMAGLNDIEVRGETILTGAGVHLSRLIGIAEKVGLSGVEPLAGIPGEVGGAIAKNAGSFGREIRDLLISVRVLTWENELVELAPEELSLSYRSSKVDEIGIIVSAKFQLKEGDKERIREEIEETLRKRKELHPMNCKSAGCIFKNPESELTAGQLLEKAGLKGVRIGDAMYSEIHANFIVNLRNASSKDVLELIKLGKERVREKFGIELEEEIVIVKN